MKKINIALLMTVFTNASFAMNEPEEDTFFFHENEVSGPHFFIEFSGFKYYSNLYFL